jgi:hypothetical protein
MLVLVQPSVRYLLETKDPLNYPKDMLDLGPNRGVAPIGRHDRLINALTPSVALAGEVLRSGCARADRRLLAAVSLIAPHSPFLAVQQILQGLAVSHVHRRQQHRMHKFGTAVN